MNEEKIAKSARLPYVILYSIMIAIGLIWVGLGAFFVSLADSEMMPFCCFWLVLGIIVAIANIYWLIYFVRMPEYSITYKDGKLNFRNRLECTPSQLDYIESKGLGLDGAIFGFGRVIVFVGGKKYRFNYIQSAQEVANRLIALKNAEVAKNTSAFGNAFLTAQPSATEAEKEQPEDTQKEDDNGEISG